MLTEESLTETNYVQARGWLYRVVEELLEKDRRLEEWERGPASEEGRAVFLALV
jgi:hypothetical protein